MEMERDELFFDLDEYSKEMDGIVKWKQSALRKGPLWDSVVAAY